MPIPPYHSLGVYLLDSRITKTSSNIRVSVGSTVTFECTTDSGLDIRWYFCRASGCDKRMVIYNGYELGPKLLPRFAVTFITKTPPVRSQLKITDVELADSGTYSCAEADTFSRQRDFILQVLGNYNVGYYSRLKISSNNNNIENLYSPNGNILEKMQVNKIN